jgi:hypothetical protein
MKLELGQVADGKEVMPTAQASETWVGEPIGHDPVGHRIEQWQDP